MFARSVNERWSWQVASYGVAVAVGMSLLFPALAKSADGPAASDSAETVRVAVAQPENSQPEASQADLQQLRSMLQEQSAEIEQLTRALKEQQTRTQALEDEFKARRARESAGGDTSIGAVRGGSEASSPMAPEPAELANRRGIGQAEQPIGIVAPEHPLSIKIGGANFTPGGFLDLTAISRSADVGSGLGTNFTILPYSNTLPLGRLSEFRFTAQASRLSLKVDAKPGKSTALSGYFESDFNGFEPANSNVSSKSGSFRLRLAFLQIRHEKWELVAGQTWSLLTPTRQGVSPYPESVFTALRLDTSYLAGLVYDRQPGVRIVYHAKDWWTLALALENPQQFVPSSVVFPTDGSPNFFSTQFDNGSSSTSAASSTVNPTVPNLHPDAIAKTAFDWRVDGKLFHVDAGGVVRTFRMFDNLAAPAGTRAITGGGGGINANFEAIRNLHLIANSFYGDGVGRYIGGLGPDAIVKPNGSLSTVRAGSGVGGIEWQATPKFLVDGYYSGAYFWRNYDLTTPALGASCSVGAGTYCVGFGYPGSANTNNRDYQEASLGLIPTIFSSPNFGKLQVISQFAWVVRVPWYVAPGNPKNAHAFLSYASLRYIVP
jgi:hypothetical protein